MTTDHPREPVEESAENARQLAEAGEPARAAGPPRGPSDPPEPAAPVEGAADASPPAAAQPEEGPGESAAGRAAQSGGAGPLATALERRNAPGETGNAGRPPSPPRDSHPGRRPPSSGSRPASGRQRRGEDRRETAGEDMAAVNDLTAPRVKVQPPSRRDPLSPDLEEALASAMAGASMEDLVASASPGGSGDLLEIESRHWATVVKIHGDNVFFSLGGPSEAVASLRQFLEPPPVGAQVEVVVRSYHADDGLYEVGIPGSSVDVHDWSDLTEGAVVEARVTGSNVGGLECMVGGIRGFIPASQIEMHRVEQYGDYYDKKLPCVVTEANERKRNLVLSHRALLEREKEEDRKKLLEELEAGQVREGVVTSVRDFGAFVDLGGVDGLVHVSQLSWDRVSHPSEVLQVGQRVRVKVEKVNPETGKISLSYRDLLERPWDSAGEQFALQSVVKGTVTRIAKFGAFVKIAPGIEGLIHISELAHHRVVQVSSVVQEGEEVEVKILSIDPENQRIGLSLKAAHPLAEVGTVEPTEEDDDAPPPEPALKPHQGPLRGGMDRSSGGDKFGLQW